MQCLFVAPAGATLRIDTRHRAATGFFDVLLHLFEIIGRCIVVLPCDFHRHGLVHWFNRIDIRVDQGRETIKGEPEWGREGQPSEMAPPPAYVVARLSIVILCSDISNSNHIHTIQVGTSRAQQYYEWDI